MIPDSTDVTQVAPGKGWQNYSADDIEEVCRELGGVANARQAAILDVVWGCFHTRWSPNPHEGHRGVLPVSEIARLSGMSETDVWTEIIHILLNEMDPDWDPWWAQEAEDDDDRRIIQISLEGKEDDVSPRMTLIGRSVERYCNDPEDAVYTREENACRRAGFKLLRNEADL